jgi:hypothetical protein
VYEPSQEACKSQRRQTTLLDFRNEAAVSGLPPFPGHTPGDGNHHGQAACAVRWAALGMRRQFGSGKRRWRTAARIGPAVPKAKPLSLSKTSSGSN